MCSADRVPSADHVLYVVYAQLTVFRVLFTKWQEFCQFRNQITEDKMLPTLERLRKKNVVAEKKRLRESEEKQQRVNSYVF